LKAIANGRKYFRIKKEIFFGDKEKSFNFASLIKSSKKAKKFFERKGER
jgi:hypothetical protein